MFFAALIETISVRFSEDEVIMQNLVHLKEESRAGGGYTAGQFRRVVWAMLYADDAGVTSKSADGLARMAIVIVEEFWGFRLMVSEKDGERPDAQKEKSSHSLRPPLLITEAAGQRNGQTNEFRYLGSLVHETGNLTQEKMNQLQEQYSPGACFRRYARQLFDRTGSAVPAENPPI